VAFDEPRPLEFSQHPCATPEPNRRILFAYSRPQIEIKNGVIHYGDVRHEISGEARNLSATIAAR